MYTYISLTHHFYHHYSYTYFYYKLIMISCMKLLNLKKKILFFASFHEEEKF